MLLFFLKYQSNQIKTNQVSGYFLPFLFLLSVMMIVKKKMMIMMKKKCNCNNKKRKNQTMAVVEAVPIVFR